MVDLRLATLVAVAALGATAGPSQAAGEPVVALSAASYEVSEGAGSLLVTVTKTGTGAGSVQLSTVVPPGSAVPAADYTFTAQAVSFGADDTTAQVPIPILEDSEVEASEMFSVELSAPLGVVIGAPGSATATITDNDAAPLPTASPTPSATPVATCTPVGRGALGADPTPTAGPTAVPTATPTPCGTPCSGGRLATAEPTPTAAPTASPTPTAVPTCAPSPTATPTATPTTVPDDPLDPQDPFDAEADPNTSGGATLTLDAPTPGTFDATATAPTSGRAAIAARRTIAKGRARAKTPGPVELALKPTRKGRKIIRRKGRLKVRVTVTFTSPTIRATDRLRVTLRARKSGRRSPS
jgi:hypothetical protein